MLKSTINRMISTSKLTNNVNFALKQQRTFIQSTNNKSNQTKLLQQTKNQTLEKLQNVNNNMNQTSLKNGKSLLPLIGAGLIAIGGIARFSTSAATTTGTSGGVSATFLMNQLKAEEQRVQRRLKFYNMKRKPITGDGNCQFRAIADQIYMNEQDFALVRENAVSWLTENENFEVDKGTKISEFLFDFPSWDAYCDEMAQDGVWGDQLTLMAIAEKFQVRLWILSSSDCIDEKAAIIIEPRQTRVRKTVYLLHWLERGHYESLVPNAAPTSAPNV